MRNIKLTIEYDGRRYLGWQRLGDSEKTIQGKIESTLKQMTGEVIEITGSGRTDAGTHARGQVANFKTTTDMTREQMLSFLNRYLPNDIVITKIEEMPERFHARYNVKGKKYSYNIWNSEVPTALHRHTSFHVKQPLDLDKMQAACERLIGEHDFIGFSSLKKSKKSTIRTLQEISIVQHGNLLECQFIGEGFLYNMVRIMMGTIIEIGLGKLPVEVIDEIFEKKIRQQAGETVPAHALFLDEVYY
ncbi:tRNA pseudouridine(38-40) synthase TruA [Vagococcus xieshaowenii]|uniref:tRNA pseudouridine synthase A n=1 Tax=Vagococcus xieshaowenii TaxID=2562451 RepID=A0A4Z0D7K8_9ENTE|nr:tRNA pseudouridine(38-40) synthase TruA [Vagococcus xieshaowenii]QCA29183.1 tRNA pseudouridine(38-40) synthase TruA [Vagococcus xieshaowenii]TFZ40839.1 tRNA pseudouridine(38-40) synthase TruA [Vagococcus xieshaowenii]